MWQPKSHFPFFLTYGHGTGMWWEQGAHKQSGAGLPATIPFAITAFACAKDDNATSVDGSRETLYY